jgi:hypothetical protein
MNSENGEKRNAKRTKEKDTRYRVMCNLCVHLPHLVLFPVATSNFSVFQNFPLISFITLTALSSSVTQTTAMNQVLHT